MQNEMSNIVSEFYKCDCQDCFFDILSTDLNLEGVVYFFQNTLPPVIEAIEKQRNKNESNAIASSTDNL